MATAEEFVKSTLIAARKQLRKEEEEARKAAAQKRAKSSNLPPTPAEKQKRAARLNELRIQIRLLKEIKGLMDEQHAETTAHFTAIEERDALSSKQGVRLTIISSAISPVIGWMLSLIGSPGSVLHVLSG